MALSINKISSDKRYRVIVSGGGTGGHFYPAVAIAEGLKKVYGEQIEILFVGANGKMEMDKIPAMGWPIIGLNIAGLQRRLSLKNLTLPFKVIGSYIDSRRIVKRFKPQVAIGSGGYVTLPIIDTAARFGAKTMIWEGNSYMGMANRRLAKRAHRIFAPHSKMEGITTDSRVIVAGVPLRGAITINSDMRQEGYSHFGINCQQPTILITGGSLGTMIFNSAVMGSLEELSNSKINVIWQCGGAHYDRVKGDINTPLGDNIKLLPFIDRMDLAYNVADVVISRAGASSLAELALTSSAAIVVPSSRVPDNHQEKNATVYANGNALVMILDNEAPEKLIPTAIELINSPERRELLKQNIKSFAIANSVDIVVNEVIKVFEEKMR